MEVTKALVCSSEDARNGEFGWVYVFIPEICGETKHTIELIDLDTFNRLSGHPKLADAVGGFLKKNFANMPLEILAFYEDYMYNEAGIDMSDEMNQLAQQCIDADKVAKLMVG